VTNRLRGIGALLTLALLAGGCAAGQAFRQGDAAMRKGNLDQAVVAYRRAVQDDPDNPRYKIALERAMQAASRFHLERARQFEAQDQLEAALGEYKAANEYDPSNRGIAAKVASIEKTLRDRQEAARPKPAGQQLRERARAASAEPILIGVNTRFPLRFNNTSFKDALNFIAAQVGINVTFDREVVDRPMTIQLDDVTLEQALNQIMTMNQLSYKIINERSIFVFQDTQQKHTQYDEQVIRTFYIQHADATEMQQIISTLIRLPNIAVQPAITGNKTSNTITVRASTTVMQILEKVIDQNDKPRAEVVFDIEILEVDRQRAKSYGIDLTSYAVGAVFSPVVSPSSTTTAASTTPAAGTTGTTGTTPVATTTVTGTSTPPNAVVSPPAFNLNTISQGINTADFYLAVPAAVVNAMESDTKTKLLAKPQLRGSEGTKMTVNLGTQVPIVSTSYTPIATGGAGVNPLNSFQLKDVGINLEITPRVTMDGDVLMDLSVESNSQGPNQTIAGTSYPSFVTRKVVTRLRLRDGESNLLAGLLREDESTSVQGFPGAIHLPVLGQVFSSNNNTKMSIDLIMLLTPHIVRTGEITEADLKPIYIGSQQNLGLGGPPPLIAAPLPPEAPAAAPAAPASQPPGVLVPPAGTSPTPGFVVVPQQQTPPAQPTQPPQATSPPAPNLEPAPPAASPPTAQAQPPPVVPPEPSASAPVGSAQVLISPPGTTFRVGQGPYTVPLSILGASRLTTVTLTLTYDPALLRVRTVQEGSFMRSGGANATFTSLPSPGRVDVTITRGDDSTGASGTGLLAAVVFDAVAPGSATLTLNGTGTGPGNTAMGLQFRPVTVTVQ
jgi:general secretion pathway protein D